MAGVVKGDAGEAEDGRREERDIVLHRESRAILSRSEDAAVVAHVAETELVHHRRREDVNIGNHALRAIVDG